MLFFVFVICFCYLFLLFVFVICFCYLFCYFDFCYLILLFDFVTICFCYFFNCDDLFVLLICLYRFIFKSFLFIFLQLHDAALPKTVLDPVAGVPMRVPAARVKTVFLKFFRQISIFRRKIGIWRKFQKKSCFTGKLPLCRQIRAFLRRF